MTRFQKEITEEFYPAREDKKDGRRKKKVYVYRGDYCIWDADLHTINTAKKRCVGLLILAIGCYLFGACINTEYNRSSLVVVPSVCAIIPLLFLLQGAVQFCMTGDEKMMKSVCQGIGLRLVVGGWFGAALLTLSFLAIVYCLFVVSFSGASLLVGACYLLSAAACAGIACFHKRLPSIPFSINEPPERYIKREKGKHMETQ